MEAMIAQPPVTLSDVAAKAGVSYQVAVHAMGGKYVSAKTGEKVLAAARELGYVRPVDREKKQPTAKKFMWKTAANPAVFASREAETAAMLKLRNQCFTNAQIAKKTGVSYGTVFARIGKQPDSITKMSRKLAGASRSAKVTARIKMQHRQKLEAYNSLVSSANAALAAYKEAVGKVKAAHKDAVIASVCLETPLPVLTKLN